ncbi:MAG: BrnT family toxin, partial [Mangrovicoccus sp.]
MHINYDWDEEKRQRTLAERGVDFAEAAGFEWETALIVGDKRRDYGEPRFRALGLIKGRLYAMVFTPRGDMVRII